MGRTDGSSACLGALNVNDYAFFDMNLGPLFHRRSTVLLSPLHTEPLHPLQQSLQTSSTIAKIGRIFSPLKLNHHTYVAETTGMVSEDVESKREGSNGRCR